MSTWILCQWSEEGQIDYAGYSAHSHHTARSKCFHCIKPPSWSHISVIVQSRRCSTPCLVTTLQWRGCDLARSGDPRSGAGSGVPHPAHAAARACTCHTGGHVTPGPRWGWERGGHWVWPWWYCVTKKDHSSVENIPKLRGWSFEKQENFQCNKLQSEEVSVFERKYTLLVFWKWHCCKI